MRSTNCVSCDGGFVSARGSLRATCCSNQEPLLFTWPVSMLTSSLHVFAGANDQPYQEWTHEGSGARGSGSKRGSSDGVKASHGESAVLSRTAEGDLRAGIPGSAAFRTGLPGCRDVLLIQPVWSPGHWRRAPVPVVREGVAHQRHDNSLKCGFGHLRSTWASARALAGGEKPRSPWQSQVPFTSQCCRKLRTTGTTPFLHEACHTYHHGGLVTM